jgi:DNA polymerase elongation subunit (family B)
MKAQNTLKERFFHKTLIIDIETVPEKKGWQELPEPLQQHWLHKASYLNLSEEAAVDAAISYAQRAGIFAEFGKIVCIGLGIVTIKDGEPVLRLKALKHDDEKALLQEFSDMIGTMEQQRKGIIFCGHNIKEFDLPYICRRLLIHGMPLPGCLKLSGKKPWEIPHEDTLELWRFGDYKHYTSLDLLANCLGVPSSKTDMDGSMVADAYWKENRLEDIARYCLQDIYTTTRVYLKLKEMDLSLNCVYA